MNGWEVKKLSEVCQVDKSQGIHKNLPYVGMENIESNTARFIGSTEPQSVKSASFSFTTKHLLYGRLRPYLNKVIAPEFEGHCSTELFPIKPSKCLDRNFLLYWFLMDSTVRLINATCTGARMPRANMNTVLEFEFLLPPLSEQKRIVLIVDEAFEGIDRAIANTKKNRTNARELFESYLNTILSGQGKQWKETTLGKEIDLLTGFAFKSSGYTDSDKSIRLLRGDNIIPGSLRWDGVKRWQESKVNEYLRYQLQEGDVVLAMDRPWIKTGLRRAQISKDDLPCLLVQRTACLRGGDNLENRFLLYLISGRAFTQHVLGSQTGLSVPHISGTQIQSFKFSKPSLREQYSIIDSLDELKSETKRLEAIYQRKLAALKELKQSILRKAFTGELTADTTNQATKSVKEVIAA